MWGVPGKRTGFRPRLSTPSAGGRIPHGEHTAAHPPGAWLARERDTRETFLAGGTTVLIHAAAYHVSLLNEPMHIYSPILVAYEQFRRACQTRGCCLWVSHCLLESRSKLTGEVRGQLDCQRTSQWVRSGALTKGIFWRTSFWKRGTGLMKSETATPAVTPQPMSDERKGRRSLHLCQFAARVIFRSKHTRG